MAEEFLNKKILITGASSGIGKALSLYFLNAGAKVVMVGRDIETLTKIGEKFKNQAAVVKLDLSDDLLIFDLKSTTVEILSKVDIMINCAGIQFDGDVEKTFPHDYDYTMDVNLRAVFILLYSFKQFYEEQAKIVNVSCLYGTKPMSGLTGYCMSKAGLEMLTKYAAAEFASKGIRVNAVTAAPVDTNCHRYVGCSEPEYNAFKSRVSPNIPLGRLGSPQDIARTIIFLCSNRSSKITGQILKVDGGRSLTSSGYVPWKGMLKMNSRFEPDGIKPMLKLDELYSKYIKGEVTVKFPESEDEIENLMIQESNWSTKLAEAHEKVMANYKHIAKKDEYLRKTFVDKNKK